ncbi:calcineurin-like phosphoesterase [Moritella viscosa]|nr:metallophosphoesterase [Moritella viscosa]CED61988.1 calcineurin-like phosphoesterase [Moritella viscosa]SHO07804.1 Ser/Thr protein phosphatase family protein [Moritella viscosa]
MAFNRDILDNIILYGDPHGNFSEVNKIIEERKPIAIFLLGDVSNNGQTTIPLVNKLNTKVYAISGNHDFGDYIEGVDFIDWSVVTVEGIRFLGLGNATSSSGMELLMRRQAYVDVVLCHYPVISAYSDKGRFIKQIFTDTTAAVYFHGHYHNSITAIMEGCYSGINRALITDIGMIPSVNTAESAITLSLNRLGKSLSRLGLLSDLVIATEYESMTENERLADYGINNEDHNTKFVSKCLDTTKSRVLSHLLNQNTKVDDSLKGRAIKAIKLMHRRDWLLIGEDDQISNISVPVNFFCGIANHESLSCESWVHGTSKSRFNTVYLIKINENVIQKIMNKIHKRT